MDAKTLTEKLKKVKGLPLILIALAAGLGLLLIPSGGTQSSDSGAFTYGDAGTYVSWLEEKTASLITSMDGVKSCSVMINLAGGYEYYYASDQRVTVNGDSRDTQKEYVIVDSDGGGHPVLIEERMPEIAGVAVVCPGISSDTEYRILTLLTSLFDVPSNKISITK